MTAEELLAAVRRLVERPYAAAAGVWPRAAALDGCRMRLQVLCLTAYLDGDTATRAAYLYAALGCACRHHFYELAPTAAQLTRNHPAHDAHASTPRHSCAGWLAGWHLLLGGKGNRSSVIDHALLVVV